MIEQKGKSVQFYAHYIASKIGKTGLTVTIDVWEITEGGTATKVVSAGSATEIGDGLYRYILTGTNVDTIGEYIAVFKTTNTDVDQRDIPALWTVGRAQRAVWDEVLTGSTHNVTNSAGRRLRQLTSSIPHDGTAQAGSTINTIVLAADASATNGEYDPALVLITAGTGAGQCRLILQYIGATKVAVVDRDWRVTPDATSEYVIIADPGREHVNEGLVTSATSTTVVLNASASATDDAYNGQVIYIRSGTGADQAKRVIDYAGSTRTATICDTWAVTPDATSAYVMLPTGMMHDEDMQRVVWDTQLSNHTTAGSSGFALNAAGLTGDPLLKTVPGNYASGTAGAALGAIYTGVTVVSPVDEYGDIRLIYGDDYYATEARALTFTSTNWPTLTGSTISLRVQVGTTVVAIPGSVSGSTVLVPVTAANTLSIGLGSYQYDLEATLINNHVITLQQGIVHVKKDVR